jgi:arginase family enzyme
VTEALALLCRTSERSPLAVDAVRELAAALGARLLGEPGEPRAGGWEEDLAAARGCLRTAARAVGAALDAGRRPLLIAGHCPVCLGTLPALAARRPEARVAWLDAHPDFNDPSTSPSGFLGGMCLAGACGVWDAGLDAPPLDPARVHLVGARDVDPGEAELLRAAGVAHGMPDGGEVFVHLDLDVLSGDEHPAEFPAPGGLTWEGLRATLAELAATCTVIGVEVTGPAPGHGPRIADTLAPLL